MGDYLLNPKAFTGDKSVFTSHHTTRHVSNAEADELMRLVSAAELTETANDAAAHAAAVPDVSAAATSAASAIAASASEVTASSASAEAPNFYDDGEEDERFLDDNWYRGNTSPCLICMYRDAN